MTTAELPTSGTRYAEGTIVRAPLSLRTRGTALVVPGRGESVAGYQRLSARLSADAYDVRVMAPPCVREESAEQDLVDYSTYLRLGLDGISSGPLIAVGSDIGALALLALAGRGALPVDALVLAGVPGGSGAATSSWSDELASRSACHVYQQVLSDDPDVAPGALTAPVPAALLRAAYSRRSPLPHLFLVGSEDALAAGPELTAYARTLSAAEELTVHGAHHDVLNDIQHRSVAAAVVTFLERVTSRTPRQPIITVEHTAW